MAEPIAHETRDVKLKWVLITAAVLTATAVTIHVALFGLQWAFMRFGGTAGQLPSQPAPPKHLFQRQESEAILKKGRAKVDAGKVSIDRAIDMVVERGWKTAPPKGGRR